jgi:2-keto-4-pentenoate hydratase
LEWSKTQNPHLPRQVNPLKSHKGCGTPSQSLRCATRPAIEVADVDHPSEDVEGTLVRNIYQRHVIVGNSRPTEGMKLLTGLRARVFRNDAELADTTDLEALTGELIDIVRHIANLLKVFGEKLEAGQMIIAGSITPPIWVEPGEQIRFELVPVAAISVGFEPRRQR